MAPVPASQQKVAPTHAHPAPEASFERDSDRRPPSSHSRGTSNAVSFVESPAVNRHQVNPFSPPSSIISYSSGADLPSGVPPSPSGLTSRATSIGDFSRMSVYQLGGTGSRPNTAEYGLGANRSSSRLREAFTPPPMRPLTVHSTAPSLKVERARPKSTMLSAGPALHKPWVGTRDPYSRISYFLTYGVMFLGIIAGAVRCYIAWRDVPLIQGNLCLVMDENFDSEEGIFGDNGKFFREVDMSGFG